MMLNVPIISNLVTSLGKYLQKGSIKESDIAVIKPQLDFLMHLFPLPKYPCMPAQLERLTINRKVPLYTDDRIDKLEYIKYPDESYVKTYGRCNIIGQPVLYGGFNLLTIIKEMQPETGITITHSQWKLKEEKPLNMFPIFFITQYQDQPHNSLSIDIKELHYAYTKKFSEHDKRGFDLAMEFFAKCFAKEIDETNHFDYFISAYISKKIFDIKDLSYDGILFPSVQMKLGFSNMAIKPTVFDEKFKPVEVKYEMNNTSHGRNGINNVLCWTNKFDVDQGLIMWDR